MWPQWYTLTANRTTMPPQLFEWRQSESSCISVHVLSHWLVSNSLDPMGCSPPGSSVHGISQARVPEWAALSFSRGPSWPRDGTRTSCVSCFRQADCLLLSRLGSPIFVNNAIENEKLSLHYHTFTKPLVKINLLAKSTFNYIEFSSWLLILKASLLLEFLSCPGIDVLINLLLSGKQIPCHWQQNDDHNKVRSFFFFLNQ